MSNYTTTGKYLIRRNFKDFFDKEITLDLDNGFNKFQTKDERNLSLYQLIDRYNKKYDNECDENKSLEENNFSFECGV